MSYKLTEQDLLFIRNQVQKEYQELSYSTRLVGMKQDFTHAQQIAVCYLQAILNLLIQKKFIKNDLIEIALVNSDSEPMEDDYI